jgi:hypothetical protein
MAWCPPPASPPPPPSRHVQVFPFSSTRKRMSSLVATGPPLMTPGTGGAGQPARLYVKGAAELLLDSCRLQVRTRGGGASVECDTKAKPVQQCPAETQGADGMQLRGVCAWQQARLHGSSRAVGCWVAPGRLASSLASLVCARGSAAVVLCVVPRPFPCSQLSLTCAAAQGCRQACACGLWCQ